MSKRLGTSSFLLFSAICGMAGTSVASAAAENDIQKDAKDVRNTRDAQKDAEEQSDIIDDEDDVPVDYSELEDLLKETDEVSYSLTKILAVVVPPIVLAGGAAAYLYSNPDSRKKIVETVFGDGKIFGKKEVVQEKTADLEKLFDEWYAKRKAAEEKAEKEKAEKTEKVKEEPSEKLKAWKRLMARANKGMAFISTPRTRSANWVFGVLDSALPRAVSQKLKAWFYLDNADENGMVFNVLYAIALVYGIINIFRLIYTNPDVLSKEYFVAPFHAKEGTAVRKRLQRGKIVLLKTLDATLRLLVPPYAFLRAGLEFAGDMYYSVEPVKKLKDLSSKVKTDLNDLFNKIKPNNVKQEEFSKLQDSVRDLVSSFEGLVKDINKNFEIWSKRNDILNKRIRDINNGLDDIRQRIIVNKAEIGKINDKIKTIEDQKFGENINNMNQRINGLEGQLKGVVNKDNLDEMNNKIKGLEEVKKQNGEIKDELKNRDVEDEKLGENINKINQEIGDLKNNIKGFVKNEEFNNKVNEIEQEINNLKEELSKKANKKKKKKKNENEENELKEEIEEKNENENEKEENKENKEEIEEKNEEENENEVKEKKCEENKSKKKRRRKGSKKLGFKDGIPFFGNNNNNDDNINS